jgi:hypothetical protein
MTSGVVVKSVGAVEVPKDPPARPMLQDGVPPGDLGVIDRDRLDIVSTDGVPMETMEALVSDPDDD